MSDHLQRHGHGKLLLGTEAEAVHVLISLSTTATTQHGIRGTGTGAGRRTSSSKRRMSEFSSISRPETSIVNAAGPASMSDDEHSVISVTASKQLVRKRQASETGQTELLRNVRIRYSDEQATRGDASSKWHLIYDPAFFDVHALEVIGRCAKHLGATMIERRVTVDLAIPPSSHPSDVVLLVPSEGHKHPSFRIDKPRDPSCLSPPDHSTSLRLSAPTTEMTTVADLVRAKLAMQITCLRQAMTSVCRPSNVPLIVSSGWIVQTSSLSKSSSSSATHRDDWLPYEARIASLPGSCAWLHGVKLLRALYIARVCWGLTTFVTPGPAAAKTYTLAALEKTVREVSLRQTDYPIAQKYGVTGVGNFVRRHRDFWAVHMPPLAKLLPPSAAVTRHSEPASTDPTSSPKVTVPPDPLQVLYELALAGPPSLSTTPSAAESGPVPNTDHAASPTYTCFGSHRVAADAAASESDDVVPSMTRAIPTVAACQVRPRHSATDHAPPASSVSVSQWQSESASPTTDRDVSLIESGDTTRPAAASDTASRPVVEPSGTCDPYLNTTSRTPISSSVTPLKNRATFSESSHHSRQVTTGSSSTHDLVGLEILHKPAKPVTGDTTPDPTASASPAPAPALDLDRDLEPALRVVDAVSHKLPVLLEWNNKYAWMRRWVSTLLEIDGVPTLSMRRFSSTGSLILVLVRPAHSARPVGLSLEDSPRLDTGDGTTEQGSKFPVQTMGNTVKLYLIFSTTKDGELGVESRSCRLFLQFWKSVLSVRKSKSCIDHGVFSAVLPNPVFESYKARLVQNSRPREAEQLVEQIEACCNKVDIADIALI